MNSTRIGDNIQEAGYLVSYNSEYLRERNWIQICLMGDCARDKVTSLLNALKPDLFQRIKLPHYRLSRFKRHYQEAGFIGHLPGPALCIRR